MTSELKACPFCGGDAEHLTQRWGAPPRNYHSVKCSRCGIWQDSRSDDAAEAAAIWNTRPEAADKQLTDVVEKCRDRFAEYVELHRAKLTDDAVLNVREAIWRKVEHNQEMVRMCDEALASLNIARALAEADGYDFDKLAHPDCLTSPRMNSKGHWLHLARAALKATTHTEGKAK
jgi:hypothetical protein